MNRFGTIYRVTNEKDNTERLYSNLVSAVFAYVQLRPLRRYWRSEAEQEENPYKLQRAIVEWEDVQA